MFSHLELFHLHLAAALVDNVGQFLLAGALLARVICRRFFKARVRRVNAVRGGRREWTAKTKIRDISKVLQELKKSQIKLTITERKHIQNDVTSLFSFPMIKLFLAIAAFSKILKTAKNQLHKCLILCIVYLVVEPPALSEPSRVAVTRLIRLFNRTSCRIRVGSSFISSQSFGFKL